MKKKIIEIIEIQKVLATISIDENDKLTYAIKKTMANLETAIRPIVTELNENFADARATFAATGEKGVILTDENGNYKFDKKGAKDLAAKNKEIINGYNETEVEFSPYLSAPCPRILELDLYTVELLTGIVINPDFLTNQEA